MQQNMSTQDLLDAIRQEVLATTMLPFAIDFMAGELRLTGGFATAMAQLPHYFTPFQTYVVAEAERAEGRFDFRIALEILQREVEYRVGEASPQGIFLYQFETLCRNRLGYDRGLEAIARDPSYDEAWREWILTVRRQIGLVDFADMIYVRSGLYLRTRQKAEKPMLFGEKEGRIALANRRKDPLYLFAALAAASRLSDGPPPPAGRHTALRPARVAEPSRAAGNAVEAPRRGTSAAASIWRGSMRASRRRRARGGRHRRSSCEHACRSLARRAHLPSLPHFRTLAIFPALPSEENELHIVVIRIVV